MFAHRATYSAPRHASPPFGDVILGLILYRVVGTLVALPVFANQP
jgi:hypothetical protein